MLISVAKCAFIREDVLFDLDQYTVGCIIIYPICTLIMLIKPIFFPLTFLYLFKVMICNNIGIVFYQPLNKFALLYPIENKHHHSCR